MTAKRHATKDSAQNHPISLSVVLGGTFSPSVLRSPNFRAVYRLYWIDNASNHHDIRHTANRDEVEKALDLAKQLGRPDPIDGERIDALRLEVYSEYKLRPVCVGPNGEAVPCDFDSLDYVDAVRDILETHRF